MFDICWKKLKNKFINESLRFVLNKGDDRWLNVEKRRKLKRKLKKEEDSFIFN